MLIAEDKFRIFHRDRFMCAFCGDTPGCSGLEVDHLVPQSIGGSDNDENLISACMKCNRGKTANIIFPHSMIEGPDQQKGWMIHRSFGIWSIKFTETQAVIESTFGYWFGMERFHEPDWVCHIKEKEWPLPHSLDDFINCLQYGRRLVCPRRIR